MKISPDAQFVPSLKNVTAILGSYGMSVRSFDEAKSGIENCTVFVDTDKGNFVLRIYRQDKKTYDEMSLELRFVQYLHEHAIPVAPAITNLNGDALIRVHDNGKTWCAILMPLLGGTHAREYSDALMKELASVQAKIHSLAQEFHYSAPSASCLSELRETHFIGLIKDRHKRDAVRTSFINRAESYLVTIDPSLPSGLCHLDYDNGNVLSDNHKVTAVLDFDDLQYSPYVLCLAYTVWDIAFDKGMPALSRYIEEYEKHRRLSSGEKEALMPMVLFRHYVIGCKDLADNQMNDELLLRYIELEKEMKKRIN